LNLLKRGWTYIVTFEASLRKVYSLIDNCHQRCESHVRPITDLSSQLFPKENNGNAIIEETLRTLAFLRLIITMNRRRGIKRKTKRPSLEIKEKNDGS